MYRPVQSVWLVVLLFAASASKAALFTKELNNVEFEDGGMATGFVVLDTALNRISDFDIRTTSGTDIDSSFEYRLVTARIAGQSNGPGSGWPDSFVQLVSLPGQDGDANCELFLTFSGPLTGTTASTILHEGGLGTSSYEREFLGEHLQELRSVHGPALMNLPAVPEPSLLVWLAPSLSLTYALRAGLRRRYPRG